MFAVGDEKQSIFSFQGAEPKQFATMHHRFATKFELAGMHFREVRFQYSFRSAPIVLQAVDTVFSREQAFAGLTEVPGATVHEAVRASAPGTVELWPMIEPDEKREIEGWDAPFDETQETSPRVRLARRIAAHGEALDRAARVGRRGPRGTGRRHSGAGSPARRAVRGGHQRTEEGRHRGRGRRPADAHRAYRRDGPDGARRRAAAAGRRSGARQRAEEPAVRRDRRAAFRTCL